jgi:predicted AlkP superfamily pyrophosphatase or phosphodiesterase
VPRVQVRHIALKLGLPLVFAVACGFCAISSATQTSNQSRHVVVVVWDGMRPDFVSEQNTPTLWKLVHEGVTFRNHHSVYPSATNVNGTALITGVYPGKNGIIANHVYRPDIDSRNAIDVENPAVVKRGDELSGGKYVSLSTIAELVQRAGGRTIMASAKTVGLLLDRKVEHASGLTSADDPSGTHALPSQAHVRNSVTLFAGKSLPGDALAPITDVLGPFPSGHVQQDAWTTKAVTDFLVKDGVPTLSILWLGEPDLTQHESAPGAPEALTAIKSADENLASVLSALDRQKARETTDLFVVSDHGFSTIRRSIDLRKILNDAGFRARTQFTDEPKTGDIMLAGNGGSVLFYIIGQDETLTRRLIEFLQQSDFAGVIFTRKPLQGTFVIEQAMIQNDHAPDVVMAFRWNDSKNQFGVPGMIDADWQRAAGKGTHATLSRFDMHNTLIAAGPDFRRGEADDLPSGNIDLAPTILRILGITSLRQLDGRILSEAMTDSDPATATLKPENKMIEATKAFPSGSWRQSLQISRVGSTIYLDQGNGAFDAKR